ncbi:MAG: hypothetical protein ACTSUK_09595 [Promethearchaeota archaeon]
MVYWTLSSGRGTNLWQNGDQNTKLYIHLVDSPAWENLGGILAIIEDVIAPINHMGLRVSDGYMLLVPPKAAFMIMNLTSVTIEVEVKISGYEKGEGKKERKEELGKIFKILYNPYLLENKPHETIDPSKILSQFSVPTGYTDILAKWYSVKFTYPSFNLIFLQPGLGISLQTHQLREEHWKIQQGHPIIIVGSKVYLQTSPKQEFHIPLGSKHTIINPSASEWVILEETYTGTFDEEDITRLFNPNRYNSPNTSNSNNAEK